MNSVDIIGGIQQIANSYDSIAITLRKFIVAVESYRSNFVVSDKETGDQLSAALGCSGLAS